MKIEKIRHVEQNPGIEYEQTFLAMVDKFNQMVDIFNEHIAPKSETKKCKQIADYCKSSAAIIKATDCIEPGNPYYAGKYDALQDIAKFIERTND